MLSRAYSEAAVETLDILQHTNKNAVNKIPKRFIRFLKNNASKDYQVELDHSKPIYEMDIKEETKGILGMIYRNWWCSEEEKERIKQSIAEKEKNKHKNITKQYDPDDIFKKKIKNKENDVETSANNIVAMTEHKEGLFTKIINKIKKVFHIN